MKKTIGRAGRPRKASKRQISDRKGILPPNANLQFELVHDNPNMFTAMFAACKKNNIETNILITPTTMIIYCESTKTQGCFINFELFGNRVCGYYCEKPRTFKCKSLTILEILKSKLKQQEKFAFSISKDRPYTLQITYYSLSGTVETLLPPIEDTEAYDFSAHNDLYRTVDSYPLKFTWKWSEFKDYMNKWKKFTNKSILFEKDISLGLRMSFTGNELSGELQPENSSDFKISYTGDDILAISIPILRLTTISPIDSLSGEITFYMKENSDLILFAKIDELIEDKDKPIPNSESAHMKCFIQLNMIG